MSHPDRHEALKKLAEDMATKDDVSTSTDVIDERIIDLLIEFIKDKNQPLCLREQAIEVLGRLGRESILPQLVTLLQDENPYIRQEAAVALGKIGDRRAVESLVESLKDSELHVRRAAAEALAQLEYPQSVEPLISAIKYESDIVNALSTWMSLRWGADKEERLPHELFAKAISKTATYSELVLTEGQIGNSVFVEQTLTPKYLAEKLIPYLQAIVDLQHIINEIRQQTSRDVRIIAITQKSPISVSLEGASEALQLVREIIVPWRRKHAERLALLLEQEKVLEIESKKAEILEKRALAEKERIELNAQRERVERLRLENEKLRLELQRAKIELALQVLSTLTSHLSEEDKINYVIRLLQPLNVITSSDLEIVSSQERPTRAST